MTRTAYVYILASKRYGTLYTGVTNDLHRRMFEHQNHLVDGFTKNYDVTRLVWFVAGNSMTGALELEKKIKNRGRQWKIDLVEKSNPQWRDLSEDWMDPATPLRSAQDDGGGCAMHNSSESPVILRNFAEPKTMDAMPSLCSTQDGREGKP